VTESLLNCLASQGYKVSKKKAQLCLPQVTYLGVVLKGQAHFLSHKQIHQILHFLLPHTIKQLRAFLGVTGFYGLSIPRYAALARPFFCATANTPIWALYSKCSLQIHMSTGPMDQTPALGQEVLTSAYT
jgi:hypothetical protein